ncbi:MAG: hypothetical protein NT027_08250 [Proteobacteria bacterium]|nr:hypothetical protein [Pseudomonadota bacterium]
MAFGCASSLLSQTDNGGLQMSVAGDFQGEFGLQPTSAPDRYEPREAEFQFFAPVDHLFDASLSFAAHQEKGVYLTELHEAFIGSTKMIPRSRFKLGKFFLGIGKLNQTHRHDWAFISPPKIHEEIFGEEAVGDNGGEFTTLIPLPFFLEATLGVTNGWTFGHAHGLGTRPQTPTHYARVATFKEIGTGGFQLAGNFLRRVDYEGTSMTLFGADLVLKLKKEGTTKFLLQGEYWRRSLTPKAKPADDDTGETINPKSEITQGFYLFPDFRIRKNATVGMRIDYVIPPDPEEEGAKVEAFWGVAPQISYSPSEFSRFRLGMNYRKKAAAHEHEGETETGGEEEAGEESEASKSEYDKSIEVQVTFILGSHPAHDF